MVELRRYTLHPGRRDELISLFEREFVEPQEEAGAHLFGLFRSPGVPEQFVSLWFFPSLVAAESVLEELTSVQYEKLARRRGERDDDRLRERRRALPPSGAAPSGFAAAGFRGSLTKVFSTPSPSAFAV